MGVGGMEWRRSGGGGGWSGGGVVVVVGDGVEEEWWWWWGMEWSNKSLPRHFQSCSQFAAAVSDKRSVSCSYLSLACARCARCRRESSCPPLVAAEAAVPRNGNVSSAV